MVVARFFHVDKVNDDQTGHIPQAQLTRDFIGGFQIRFQSRFFNITFFGRPPGVDVNRDQSFGLIHNQISARF